MEENKQMKDRLDFYSRKTKETTVMVAIGLVALAGYCGSRMLENKVNRDFSRVIAYTDISFDDFAKSYCKINLNKEVEKATKACIADLTNGALPGYTGKPNEITKIEDGNSVTYNLEEACTDSPGLTVDNPLTSSKCRVEVEKYEINGRNQSEVVLHVPSKIASAYIRSHRKK